MTLAHEKIFTQNQFHTSSKISACSKYFNRLCKFRPKSKIANNLVNEFKTATLSKNRVSEYLNSSEVNYKKEYEDGEENVKDCDESETNTSKIMHDRFRQGNVLTSSLTY